MNEIMNELNQWKERALKAEEEKEEAIKMAELVIEGHNKRIQNYKQELVEELEERGFAVPRDWKRESLVPNQS